MAHWHNSSGASDPARTEDLRWMEMALQEAAQSGKDVPVGCIVARDGLLLGRACNQRETSGDPTGHAEIIALRQAAAKLGSWRLDGVTVYSTLEPCPMCAEAVIQSRVSRIIFGAYDPASGAAGSAFNLFVSGRIFPIPEVIGGLCEDECQKLLVNFFRSGLGSK